MTARPSELPSVPPPADQSRHPSPVLRTDRARCACRPIRQRRQGQPGDHVANPARRAIRTAGPHLVASGGQSRPKSHRRGVVLRIGMSDEDGVSTGLGQVAGLQPPSVLQRPGIRRSSMAAFATGMMKPPTSRTTVGKSGSSISSGSRARNDRHGSTFRGSREKVSVSDGGCSHGTAATRLANVTRIAAASVPPSHANSRDLAALCSLAHTEAATFRTSRAIGDHRFKVGPQNSEPTRSASPARI